MPGIKKLFISWSGEDGKETAGKLAEFFDVFNTLEPWVSSTGIGSGSVWFGEIEEALQQSAFGLACLSPGASGRPWVNFEVGFLFGRLRHCHLIQIGDEAVRGPLGQLQAVRGNDKIAMQRVLSEMIAHEGHAAKFVEARWPAWLHAYEQAVNRKPSILEHLTALTEVSTRLQRSPALRDNACFRAIIEIALKHTRDRLSAVTIEGSAYHSPAGLYPQYLATMQQSREVIVSALALVDEDEHFWRDHDGRKILQTSNKGSRRVFVVRNRSQLARYLEEIKQHSAAYQVGLMDRDCLSRNFPGYARDFSILKLQDSEVLADYAELDNMQTIRFCCLDDEVKRHRELFERIWSKAVFVTQDDQENILWEHVVRAASLDARLTKFDTKHVEMSAYIPIHDYDEHEIHHAYYVEMMDTMIGSLRNHLEGRAEPIRLLELGAGTGLFTRRLAAEFPEAEIVALEIDWACFKRLEAHTRRYKHVVVYNEDSRSYDPPGKFDAVLSSFSDHHIRPTDKSRYFQNVATNLKPWALFICGDEFLPPHDEEDREERIQALRRYHGHIIEIATARGQVELVTLEQAALQSGLDAHGDFKLTCRAYESHLQQVGFAYEAKKIGPTAEPSPDVGGVYVYSGRLMRTAESMCAGPTAPRQRSD